MWYSVTPENIARSIAEKFRDAGCKVVVDACCGSGGNAIQFALYCEKVIAVEIDKKRVFFFFFLVVTAYPFIHSFIQLYI